MPIFQRKNSESWVFNAERYFGLTQISKSEKLEAATICFEDEARSQYQWQQRRKKLCSGEELKDLVITHFQSIHGNTSGEELLVLRQEGLARECRRFESWVALRSDARLEGYFINGLKPTTRAEIMVLRPTKLEHIKKMGQWILVYKEWTGTNPSKGKSLWPITQQLSSSQTNNTQPTAHNSPLRCKQSTNRELQLGRRLYHRWREKDPSGLYNKHKGLQDPIAYHLPLLSTCNIHLVIYVSQLRSKLKEFFKL